MSVFFPAQPQFSVLLALSLFFKPAPLYAGEPLELLKSAAERVIAVLKDPRLKAVEQKKERIEQLKAINNPIFDYEEVARRTLAGHWRRRTMVEQEEFTKLFRAFLEKIYSDRIGLYEEERVVFGRETVDQEYAEVESRLINLKNEENRVPTVSNAARGSGKSTTRWSPTSASSVTTVRSSTG